MVRDDIDVSSWFLEAEPGVESLFLIVHLVLGHLVDVSYKWFLISYHAKK